MSHNHVVTPARVLRRLRAEYNFRIYSAYCALWMAPETRKMYDMPSAFPWVLIVVAPLSVAIAWVRR